MSWPGLASVVTIGIGVVLAFLFFSNDNTFNAQPHGYQQRNDNTQFVYNRPRRSTSRSSKKKDDEEDDICSICREPMDNKTETLKCGHVFHSDCVIKLLLKEYRICPLCRQTIDLPS